MTETLWALGPFSLTAYSLGLALGLLLAALALCAAFKRAAYPPFVAETFLLLGFPLSLLLSRLAYVLIRLNFFLDWGEGLAFRFWQGGYSLWGAILGFLLAGWLTARRVKVDRAALMDRLAPFGLLALALGRFMEGFAGQGFGQIVPEGLSFFPLAVGNEYGEWRFAIFLLEGAAALLFILPVARRRGLPGDRMRLALILVCAFQILFESLREDEVLSWGFVKASQLLGALGLFLLMADGLLARRRNTWPFATHLAFALFFLLIFVIVGLEFAIDKTTLNINLIYLVMALCCLGLSGLAARTATLPVPRHPGPKTIKEETT